MGNTIFRRKEEVTSLHLYSIGNDLCIYTQIETHHSRTRDILELEDEWLAWRWSRADQVVVEAGEECSIDTHQIEQRDGGADLSRPRLFAPQSFIRDNPESKLIGRDKLLDSARCSIAAAH